MAIQARFLGFSTILQRYLTPACALALCLAGALIAGSAPQKPASSATPPTRSSPAAKKTQPSAQNAAATRAQELETLARQLRDTNATTAASAYKRLVALSRRWPTAEKARASLALGYYQYTQKQYASARTWFRAGRSDPLLHAFAIYWEGMAAGAADQNADAVALLGDFRKRYPYSVLDEPALEAYADAAIGEKKPELAMTALRAHHGVNNSPDLLMRLALAEEHAGDSRDAALNYQRVYDIFPMDDLAKDAKKGIDRLRKSLGRKFPEAPLKDRLQRAQTLFQHGQWRDARQAWRPLIKSVTGTERQRVNLRMAECSARISRNPDALKRLSLSAPSLDAERWMTVFEVYRSRGNEDAMKAAVDKVLHLSAPGAPSRSADRVLYLMGNYYWANLKRDQAVEYYRQLAARHARGSEAINADWRIAWTAYLENDSDAALLIRSHVERFPYSSYVPDALYWLGRLAERSDNPSRARTYYDTLSGRFAETYFGRLARVRTADIQAKPEPAGNLPLLARIPAVGRHRSLADSIPSIVHGRYQSALALRSIAFDDTAMLEFREAYRLSKAPQLLIDAARAAQGAELYLTGASLARLLVPNLEARPMDSVPASIWRIVYPLPYRSLIDEYAGRYHIDPMLFASLIRQESGFQHDIVSSAGAVGLSQLMPLTARKWSRELSLGYSRSRLVDPRYNLRVGGAYLQALVSMFGNVEEALAAYNAGENRVTAWKAEHQYNDPAEFVESIPFSQTRHYVQVVLNGAVIYRQLYENQ